RRVGGIFVGGRNLFGIDPAVAVAVREPVWIGRLGEGDSHAADIFSVALDGGVKLRLQAGNFTRQTFLLAVAVEVAAARHANIGQVGHSFDAIVASAAALDLDLAGMRLMAPGTR